MATKNLFCLLFYIICLSPASAQVSLSIEITHLRSDHGHVLLSLYDENQVQIRGLKATIKNSKSIFQINDLKPAKYAFKYFHDENDNSQLETNSLGIPIEGFGFSNNAKGFLGPPSFDKWIFSVTKDQMVQCQPKYL
ncbi:MAG TPA: DUF2141 domain-containing protein [Cyclobacteriaceae bacterium]